MNKYYSSFFTLYIKNNQPFIFIKLGDGEYCSLTTEYGSNCDGENYTPKLKYNIKEAINYLSTINNCYIGQWHHTPLDFNIPHFTNYVHYHTCLLDNYNIMRPDLLEMFRSIKNSSLFKIYICNELMIKAKSLLNIDNIIFVNIHAWFENDYEKVLQQIFNSISDTGIQTPLILTSCGMGAKVLIANIHKKYPQGIFIDIGSCLDFLLTKKDSRGWNLEYEIVENYFKDLLPSDWNDSKYDNIYLLSQKELGIHLNT